MQWRLVDKTSTAQPSSGKYRDWKNLLREEAQRQCVYCAISEARFGGYRNFHVEHYRPQKFFRDLANDIRNLFYCCAICNGFKGADWPNEPLEDMSIAAYPDPSLCDYSTFLFVREDYLASSDKLAGAYVVERLYLNRPQLLMARELAALRSSLEDLTGRALELLDGRQPELLGLVKEAVALVTKLGDISPYEPGDIERPA